MQIDRLEKDSIFIRDLRDARRNGCCGCGLKLQKLLNEGGIRDPGYGKIQRTAVIARAFVMYVW
jgi:hypothetical protein